MRPVLLFDGECNLCSSSVQFVLRHEADAHLTFTSLQSDVGRELLSRFRLPDDRSTVILIEDGVAYTRSDAVVRVARHLRPPWRTFTYLSCLPFPLRDGAYRLIARYRFRLFGRPEACWLPRPEWRSRFLDQ